MTPIARGRRSMSTLTNCSWRRRRRRRVLPVTNCAKKRRKMRKQTPSIIDCTRNERRPPLMTTCKEEAPDGDEIHK